MDKKRELLRKSMKAVSRQLSEEVVRQVNALTDIDRDFGRSLSFLNEKHREKQYDVVIEEGNLYAMELRNELRDFHARVIETVVMLAMNEKDLENIAKLPTAFNHDHTEVLAIMQQNYDEGNYEALAEYGRRMYEEALDGGFEDRANAYYSYVLLAEGALEREQE